MMFDIAKADDALAAAALALLQDTAQGEFAATMRSITFFHMI